MFKNREWFTEEEMLEIDEKVDKWHGSDSDFGLLEYLGMDEKSYDTYFRGITKN